MAEENKSVGAMWEKKGKKGTWFGITLEIKGEKHQLVGFKNEYKKEEKHPDYKIFIKTAQPQNNNAPAPKQETKEEETNVDDDLPFI